MPPNDSAASYRSAYRRVASRPLIASRARDLAGHVCCRASRPAAPPSEANRWQAVNTIPKSCYAIGAGNVWAREQRLRGR
jgi:hypothetical protein